MPKLNCVTSLNVPTLQVTNYITFKVPSGPHLCSTAVSVSDHCVYFLIYWLFINLNGNSNVFPCAQ